jgi:thiol-disulfide isomerase/thioredoxin
MKGQRLPLLVGVVGFVIVAILAAIVLSSSDGGSPEGTLDVTDPVRFDLPTIDGTGRVRLADFEGSPVVVNFFASWCEPCKEELPDLAAAARKLAGKVSFVAVNSKELSAPSGIALARRNGLAEAGITLARDVGAGGSGLHDAYNVRQAMPVNAFYDRDGKLLYVAPGQLTPDKLAERLRTLFGVTL